MLSRYDRLNAVALERLRQGTVQLSAAKVQREVVRLDDPRPPREQ